MSTTPKILIGLITLILVVGGAFALANHANQPAQQSTNQATSTDSLDSPVVTSTTTTTTTTTVTQPPVTTHPTPAPAPAHTLSITSITPSSGPVGTVVTFRGTGFTSTSQVVLESGRGAISNVTVNASGTVLSFTVPSSVGAYCKPKQACPMYAILLQDGTYDLAVRNTNDATSNSVSFTIIGSVGIQ